MGFLPHKSHATHPDHLKAQVELPFVPPPPLLQSNSAAITCRKREAFPDWELNQVAFQSQTFFPSMYHRLLQFPNLWRFSIVMKRRRFSCSKMTANKSSLMNMFVLHLKVASLRGVCPTVWVPPKEGQLLSWKGCSVPTVVFGKRARDALAFLVKIFLILALPASVLGVLFLFGKYSLTDRPVSKATAKWPLAGYCSPLKRSVHAW